MPGLLHGVDILQFLSGSVLGVLNKGDPSDSAVAKEILDGYRLLGLDALIALGGDGSLDIIDDLAQQSGITGGADAILIPETTPQLNDAVIGNICQKIVSLRQEERQFALIVVAEGVRTYHNEKEKYIGDVLAQQIQLYSQQLCETGQPEYCYLKALETRATSLGHIQRSSTPSSFDRLLAAAFGREAVELIAAEKYQRLVV